ncbi:cobalt-precorrin-6A reductase [Devosia chinhatensis]|uniref:Cobalt-precorrin-6X reductase n=1 Tax=Devosia chinhatensis TaxID=429727 RepID=A0A0F5FJJ4_9HYPH|nr:cobalt-precorrin-6A reductase [Devosia chinhatensis]KKB08735.1 hypothetical protein VE26_01240 [Devosia chinhatensis]
MKILILGGTQEARQLANRLVAQGHAVITALAGRTQHPILPQGEVRIGGFGGLGGLCAYLGEEGIERLVDATHPYAGNISANAVAAARATGVRLVRYMRRPWQPQPGQIWLDAGSVQAAAETLPAGASVLLTTGHTGLETFLARQDCHFVIRVIEAPDLPIPAHATLIQSRPPYDLGQELALMRDHGITHMVSKNSGGTQTAAKLEAAAQSGVVVIMIARPPYSPAIEAESVEAALAALDIARV